MVRMDAEEVEDGLGGNQLRGGTNFEADDCFAATNFEAARRAARVTTGMVCQPTQTSEPLNPEPRRKLEPMGPGKNETD